MTDAERERFDALLEECIEQLPERLRTLLEEVPLIVEDRPDAALVRSLMDEMGEGDATPAERREFARTLCGLHTGVPITERSVEGPAELPTDVRLFREGVVETAGGWAGDGQEDDLYDEIAITLLHEIGHHFGLDEDDLAELGYD